MYTVNEKKYHFYKNKYFQIKKKKKENIKAISNNFMESGTVYGVNIFNKY